MTKHWSNPVAIGREAFLHFFLPKQRFFTIRTSEAAMANGTVGLKILRQPYDLPIKHVKDLFETID